MDIVLIPYEHTWWPESQSRDTAGTRHRPGPLRTPLPPGDQPGARGCAPPCHASPGPPSPRRWRGPRPHAGHLSGPRRPGSPRPSNQHRVTACVAQRPPPGLLVLDAPGLPQPGRRAGGVARQSSGPRGQGAPCQANAGRCRGLAGTCQRPRHGPAGGGGPQPLAPRAMR